MVGALEFSSDPTVKECLTLLKDPEFLKWLDIPIVTHAQYLRPPVNQFLRSPRQPLNEKLRRSSTNTRVSTGILPSLP